MHVHIDFRERNFKEQQHHRVNSGWHDIAVGLGERVLHDAVANETPVNEDEDGVAIELLDLGARNEAIEANLAVDRFVLILLLRLTTPRRRLRQSGMDKRQQRIKRNELV